MNKNIVLAVDDMPEVLQCINSILNDRYDVRLAVDAASAQEVLKSTNVGLILLDIEMPGMSGLALLEKLQKNETYKTIPVVFLTSSSDDKIVKTAIKNGAKGYITKPFTSEALRESVEFFFL
jgi:CheY-like chemotaxis protein